MAVRDLAVILGEVIRKNQCQEVVVEYSCGHTGPAEVHVAPFLEEKREPRIAARALRVACRDDSVPGGEVGSFRVEVPGGHCPQIGCDAPGKRRALRCGAVAMDLGSAGEDAQNPIPVGIAAAQFSTWVQTPISEETEQKIRLANYGGATQTWRQFFTTPGSFGPFLLGILLWVLGCVLYASYAAPRIPMLTPDLFYQQVQDQIEAIPVPKHSPHYAHYRKYYLQQYQQHLQQYRELEEAWRQNKGPRLHWGALLQGLGLGTWIFVALLAFCEYRYTTVTMWMETLEDRWKAWRATESEADGGKKRKGGTRTTKKPVAKEEKEKEKPIEVQKPPLSQAVEPASKGVATSGPRRKKRSASKGENKEESPVNPEEGKRTASLKVQEEPARWFLRHLWGRQASPSEEVAAATHAEAVPKEAPADVSRAVAAPAEPAAHAGADDAGTDAGPAANAKGPLEEPAVEPEPVEPVEAQDDESEESASESEAPEQGAEALPAGLSEVPRDEGARKEAEEETGDDNESGWQVVMKGKPPKQAQATAPAPEPEPPAKEEDENFQMPKNLEALSTQDLVAMLQRASLRRQLLRRGVPIREQLLRWFQELQEPPRKLRVAYGPSASSAAPPPARAGVSGEPPKPSEPQRPKATPAPWSRLGNKGEEASKMPLMRAEAPEFFPSDMSAMPAGTVLVPCMLPPAQDGTIVIPADHVLVVGAMGLPEGVPLIVPVGESFGSLEQINTQFEASPLSWPMPMPLAPELPDVSIVDASSISFLDIPAEDHVAAAIAAAAAAEAASED